jgi:hypothetical protein
MVTVRKTDNSSPLSGHTDFLPNQETVRVLQDLVDRRDVSTDDEIFEITGTYAHIDRVAHHLNNVSMAVPQALQEVWQEEREARQADGVEGLERDRDRQAQLEKDHQKFLDKLGNEHTQLQALFKKAIDRTGDSRYLKLQALCWGLGGCIGGLGLAIIMGVFIIFPRQLSAARGSDGAMLEWLSTSDGRLMRRSFAAGNKSVAECVRKAGKKSKGKVVCMLEIN